MMNCESAKCLVLQYDLGRAERAGVGAALLHVESCVLCSAEVAEYDDIREALAPVDVDVEPCGGWTAFEERLAARAVARSYRVRLMPAALAACVAVALVGWGLWWSSPAASERQNVPGNSLAMLAGPSEQEIFERARVFDEVSQVFDGRANWVLLSDQGSDMGLDSGGPGSAANGRNLLLVRISISRDGSPFSTADLVVVPGALARSTVTAADGLQLKYEVLTSQVDPTRLRISTDLALGEHPARLGAIASEISIRMGQIASIGQVVTADGTFEFNVGLYRAGEKGRRS